MAELNPRLAVHVMEILQEEGLLENQVDLHWSFQSDLGLDSQDVIAMASVLEQRFLLPAGCLNRVHHVDNLNDVVVLLQREGICSGSKGAHELLEAEGYSFERYDQQLSDLVLDSLDHVQLVMAIEHVLDCSLSDEQALRLRGGTVQDLARVMEDFTRKGPHATS